LAWRPAPRRRLPLALTLPLPAVRRSSQEWGKVRNARHRARCSTERTAPRAVRPPPSSAFRRPQRCSRGNRCRSLGTWIWTLVLGNLRLQVNWGWHLEPLPSSSGMWSLLWEASPFAPCRMRVVHAQASFFHSTRSLRSQRCYRELMEEVICGWLMVLAGLLMTAFTIHTTHPCFACHQLNGAMPLVGPGRWHQEPQPQARELWACSGEIWGQPYRGRMTWAGSVYTLHSAGEAACACAHSKMLPETCGGKNVFLVEDEYF